MALSSYIMELTPHLRLATPHGPLPQSAFLNRMGMDIRVEALKRAAKTEARKEEIDKAASRLVDTMGMGMEYQVLGITSHGRIGDDAGAADEVWPFMGVEEPVTSQ